MSDARVRNSRPRGPLRRLLEVRGLVGGHHVPCERLELTAADGVPVVASLLPGPPAAPATVVMAHGFAAHRRKPAYAELADGLSTRHRVVSLDLRGHGESGGRSGFGGAEALDIETAVRWARETDPGPVVALGVSMGGTALVHAASRGVGLDALVLVSAPARVGRTDTEPLAVLDAMWRTPWRRQAFEVLTGVRMSTPETIAGLDHPSELIAEVEAPLLIVHGDDDHFFAFDDAEELAAQAGGPVTVWREPRFGHAEDGLDRRFARRLARAIEHVVSYGEFPTRG